MKGDFSRYTYFKKNHYSGVLNQQGRVLLDADWNEQLAIQMNRGEIEARDVIGLCGAPMDGGGFEIGVRPDLSDLTISPGRIYVDGILCELEEEPSVSITLQQGTVDKAIALSLTVENKEFKTGQIVNIFAFDAQGVKEERAFKILSIDQDSRTITFEPSLDDFQFLDSPGMRHVTTYLIQPDYPSPEFSSKPAGSEPQELNLPFGFYLVYLDVWRQHITALEDPRIREKALGGPDTTTRLKTVWQVKILPISLDVIPGEFPLCNVQLDDWDELIAPSTGKLNAQTVKSAVEETPCLLSPSSGYQRLENQLYRVEIHKGGILNSATFKWSRDNGSVVVEVNEISGSKILVSSMGRDKELGLANGQWVELTDDNRELLGRPGHLALIKDSDPVKLEVVLDTAPPADLADVSKLKHPKLRRWDQSESSTTLDGTKLSSGWLPLEDDIEVQFSEGTYKTGDYWTIPARVVTGEIEWPPFEVPNKNPISQPPEGIQHHYCRLGFLLNHSEISHPLSQDCRSLFPPLTGLKRFFYVGGAGQEAQVGGLLDQPLQVGVSNGIWPQKGAQVRFEVVSGGGTLNDTDVLTDQNGIAQSSWTLGGSGIQRVKAIIPKIPSATPIFFNASFKSAGGSGCHIPVGGESNRKELSDTLRELVNVLGMSEVCLCLAPGKYSFPAGNWVLDPDRPDVRVKITGCGHGAIIDLNKTNLSMKNLASITLKDLMIDAGQLTHDGLTLDGCSMVNIESCHLKGTTVPAAPTIPCIVLQNKDNPITLKGKKSISLMPGVGIMVAAGENPRYFIYTEISEPGIYKIRGTVATGSFRWNPQNFSGFYYDIDQDLGTEKLTTTITDGRRLSGVSPYGLRYETFARGRKFEFGDWGSHLTLGFLGKPHFAGYIQESSGPIENQIPFRESKDKNVLAKQQLLEVLVNDRSEMTVTSGTPLELKNGYELAIKSIDIDGNKVFLELSKNGSVLESKVISPSKQSATMADKTYFYRKDVGNSRSLVLIAVHFKNAFRGADQNLATVDGIWQLSDTPVDIKEGTEFDKLTITKLTENAVVMENVDSDINLSRNREIALMPNLYIRIADSEILRYSIYREEAIEDDTSKLVVRGEVATGDFTWDPGNFAGFFYDIDDDIGDETLTTTITGGNKLSGDSPYGVKYKTCVKTKKFNFKGWGSFSVLGLMAKEYLAAYLQDPTVPSVDQLPLNGSSEPNVLAKDQLLEVLANDDSEMTVTSGTPLKLKNGYELAIKSIDIEGNKVFLELTRDGAAVDKKVISPSKESATMLDKTYTYKRDVGNSKGLVLIAVHFKNSFRGADQNLATIDGIWQLSDTPLSVKDDATFDKMVVSRNTDENGGQADGVLLKISNAERISLEDNVIEVGFKSNIVGPSLISDRSAFPELIGVISAKNSESFDRSALSFSKELRALDRTRRTLLSIRLKKAIMPHVATVKPAQLESYMILINASTSDDIMPEMVVGALKSIFGAVAESGLASALAITDANADTVIENNKIDGVVGLYGIPTSKGLNQEDLDKLRNLTKEKGMKYTGRDKILQLRGNRIIRLVIGDFMTARIREVINAGGTEIKGVYKSSFFTENVIEGVNNQIASGHLAVCSNDFENAASDIGMTLSNSAIFMGNYAPNDVRIFSLSNRLNKDAGNLVINIVDYRQ